MIEERKLEEDCLALAAGDKLLGHAKASAKFSEWVPQIAARVMRRPA